MFIWTFLLRITHTIISQSIADSFWITLYVPQAILFSSHISVFPFSSHTWIMRLLFCIVPRAVNDIFWDPVLSLVMYISNYGLSQNFTILFKIWGPVLIVLLTIFGRSLIYPSFWNRHLILILLMWRIWWAPKNASRWDLTGHLKGWV
jgi:hypothetical protein